jgi:hypothetical protein
MAKRIKKLLMTSDLFNENNEIIWSGHSQSHLAALRHANKDKTYYSWGLIKRFIPKPEKGKWTLKNTLYKQSQPVVNLIKGKWTHVYV